MKRALAALVLLLLAACPGEEPAAARGEVRVLAAASLTTPLAALAAIFEASNPGTKVQLSFGSSTAHERQIEAGAPCDLYVAAAQANVERLVAAGLVDPASRTVVARNALAVIVAKGTAPPGDLDALRALPRIAVGARGVPVGDYARAALLGLDETRFAGFADESAVVTAVAAGAAPVGVCYASSLASHPRRGDLARAPFSLPTTTSIEYPAVIVRDARSPRLARAFLLLLASPRGREELTKNGFQEP